MRIETTTASLGLPGTPDVQVKQHQDLVVKLTVVGVDDNGSGVLEYTPQIIRTKSTDPNGNEENIATDADAPPDTPMAHLLQAMVGTSVRFLVSPTGEVLSVSGADRARDEVIRELLQLNKDPEFEKQTRELVGAAFDKRGLQTSLEQMLLIVPNNERSAGEHWKARINLPIPVLGQLSLSYDYTLSDITSTDDDPRAHIDSTILLEAQPVAGANLTDASGTLSAEFDLERSEIVSANTRYEFTVEFEDPNANDGQQNGPPPSIVLVSTTELRRLELKSE